MKRVGSIAIKQPVVSVVVIGGELNGLSVCRNLAEGGVPTYVVDKKKLNPAMWSRSAMPVMASTLHGPILLDTLRSLQRRIGHRPALIITDELALLTISQFRAELDGLYRLHLPSHEMVMMMHDKARFHEFAVAHDLPVPACELLRDVSEIPRLRALRFPVIIKPADKRHVHLQHVPRVTIARTWEKAVSTSRKLLAAVGEIIVQEYIDGPDSDIYFCLFYRNGGYTVMFTGRKLASSPIGCGSTAFCTQAEDVDGVLERITTKFLDLVDYSGFGGIEYKWDADVGRYMIIEPTVGRTDWQQEIAALSGINIPLAGYYAECEQPSPPPRPANNMRVVWQASFTERMKVGSQGIPADALVVDGFWRRDDPLPALVHYPFEMALSIPAILIASARRFGKHVGRLRLSSRRLGV